MILAYDIVPTLPALYLRIGVEIGGEVFGPVVNKKIENQLYSVK